MVLGFFMTVFVLQDVIQREKIVQPDFSGLEEGMIQQQKLMLLVEQDR